MVQPKRTVYISKKRKPVKEGEKLTNKLVKAISKFNEEKYEEALLEILEWKGQCTEDYLDEILGYAPLGASVSDHGKVKRKCQKAFKDLVTKGKLKEESE